MSAWYPCILFAAVILIGIPLWCWLAGDDPRNDDEPPRRDSALTLTT